MEIVLTIAGSDPSGGAGIQQDLKVITAHSCYGATVITALISQNTQGVQSSMAVPTEVVASQLQSVISDLRLSAIKIGMIPNEDVAQVIVEAIKDVHIPIIYDPVMISTSGYQLMSSDAIDFITSYLFPLCTLVTPNLPEAERLQAQLAYPQTAFLIKGGHAHSTLMTDRLIMPDGTVSEFTTEKIATNNLYRNCLDKAMKAGLLNKSKDQKRRVIYSLKVNEPKSSVPAQPDLFQNASPT